MTQFSSRIALTLTCLLCWFGVNTTAAGSLQDSLPPQPRYTLYDADEFARGTVTDFPNDADIRSNLQSIELIASGSVNCIVKHGILKPGETDITTWSVQRIQSFDPAIATIRFLDAAGNDTILHLQAAITTPHLQINGSNTICEGESRQLFAVGNAPHYLWNTGDTSRSIVVRPMINTIYSYQVTNSAGDTLQSDSVMVFVRNFPTVILFRQALTNILYADKVAAFSSYQWFRNESPIAGATERSYTATQNGRYLVYVTTAPGCTATSNVIIISDITSGLSEASEGISIYPNPVEDVIHVRCGHARPTFYTILNSLGQSEFEATIAGTSDEVKIDVKNLAAGQHTVVLRCGTKTQSFPFVKN